MLGECVVQIDFFEDSSAEGVVPALHAFRSVYRSDKSVFGIIGVGRGVELGHVAVIVVQRTDAASPSNIDFGVLVQAVCVIGLRGGVLVGTGAVSDVVEDVAHGVLRHVGGVFTDGAGDFGPLVVGVVPGCIVLKRCGCPATEGTERSFATPVQTIPVETAGLHRGQARQRISSGFCSLSSHLDLAA